MAAKGPAFGYDQAALGGMIDVSPARVWQAGITYGDRLNRSLHESKTHPPGDHQPATGIAHRAGPRLWDEPADREQDCR